MDLQELDRAGRRRPGEWMEASGQGLLVTVHDSTEHRALEPRWSPGYRMEGLGHLAGEGGPDLDKALAAILGVARVHDAVAPVDAPQAGAVETIRQASERRRTLLQALADLSRKVVVCAEDVDLNGLVREAVPALEQVLPVGVQVQPELDRGLHAVRGDAAALRQALDRLCVNAIESMPRGGVLTLRTRNDGDNAVILEVSDTGRGMPPEVVACAFDPLFTTKPHGTGSGMGLSVVYGCVRAHEGEIELDSREGEGTSAVIHLPAVKPASARQGGRSLRVLVVDDDELVQAGLTALLVQVGHDPVIMGSGEEALQYLEDGGAADAVLLDLNMPGLGGYQTLPRVRALRPGLPVVIITGRADRRAVDLAGRFERVSLLPKPFTMQEMQERLQEGCQE